MRIVAIVQARLGSQRLLRKVLAVIEGRSMLAHVVERVVSVAGLADVVVAVPRLERNRVMRAWKGCEVVGPDVPENDVLGRYAAVADQTQAEAILRVTADCPLWAPDVGQRVLDRFLADQADYAWNDTNASGYPDGTDAEVCTRDLLERANREAPWPEHREHVTPYMRLVVPCRQTLVMSPVDHSALKLSVDTSEDLARVRAIVTQLPAGAFSLADTLAAATRAGIMVGV